MYKKKLDVQYISGDIYGYVTLSINGKIYNYKFPFPYTHFKEYYLDALKYKNRGRLLRDIRKFHIKENLSLINVYNHIKRGEKYDYFKKFYRHPKKII